MFGLGENFRWWSDLNFSGFINSAGRRGTYLSIFRRLCREACGRSAGLWLSERPTHLRGQQQGVASETRKPVHPFKAFAPYFLGQSAPGVRGALTDSPLIIAHENNYNTPGG